MSSIKRFQRGLVAGTAALLVLALAACSPGAEQTPDTTNDGGDSTLRLAVSNPPATWNPALYTAAGDSAWLWSAVYDTMLRCNKQGKPGPGAAESFEVNADNTVLTMKLRDGMTFQDGTPVDAVAAKASIENMRDGGGANSSRFAGVTVEILDDLTVEVTSPTPHPTLAWTFCLPNGILASPESLASPELDSVANASGPYELDVANSTSGSIYTLVKRDDYWDADSFPNETIVIQGMIDPTARLNALKTGQIDAATLDALTVGEAEASGLTVLREIYQWAGLHISDRQGSLVPALADVRVRQAINMAFDRDAILEAIYQGEGVVTEQVSHPEGSAYEATLNDTYPYDLDEARRLIAEAGYADGFDVEIPSWAPISALVNPMIIQQLGELNIRATEVPLQNTTALGDYLSGRFALYYFPITTSRDPIFDVEATYTQWNVFRVNDSELSPMLEAAKTLRGEEAEENFRNINRFAVEEAWFVPWAHLYLLVGLGSADLVPENTGQLGTPNLIDFK